MSTNSALDAAYLTAHNYPGGIPALAARMNVNATVLSHKLNPNNNTHHLKVQELITIIHMTGDLSPLQALNLQFGQYAMQLQVVEGDEPPIEAIAATCKEFADYLQATTDAIKDGRITALEVRKTNKELQELIGTAAGLQGKLESMLSSRGGRK